VKIFTFEVAGDVFEEFPGYVVGWVAALIKPELSNDSQITNLLRGAESRTRSVYGGKDPKEFSPVAVWRSAFSGLGWSASKYPSSVEALTKRIVKGYELPSINPAVDLVNAVSLLYTVPLGCHDMDGASTLTVRKSVVNDVFLPMGEAPEESPEPGEIVYASQHRVRTRRWVWRQSRDSLVDGSASWLFFPIDGFDPDTSSNVEAATRFLASACQDYLGASVVTGRVTASGRSVEIERPKD
jgi:DNA/RNA-binding domain of Phe-tRNA-synthetase-like protein